MYEIGHEKVLAASLLRTLLHVSWQFQSEMSSEWS